MPEMKDFKISTNLDKNKVFVVNRSEVEERLDPSFYKPEFQNNIERIKKNNYAKLGDVVIFSNETWDQKSFFDNTFPYLEISEIDIKTGEILNISELQKSEAPSRAKMIVRSGDIIISTTRPHRGAISMVENQKDLIIASTGFSVIRKIKSDDKINKKFLFAVIRQQFLLEQMLQRSSGGNYPAITQDELKNLLIPIPPKTTQARIVQIMDNAYLLKKQNEAEAEKLLAGIDDYLLGELGIKLPKERNDLSDRIFKLNFSELESRLDPFYYMVEFKEIEAGIVKSGYDVVALESIFFINRGGSPRPIDKFYTEDENGVNWIKIGDTKNDDKYIYSTKQRIKPEGAKFSRKVEIGDFILSNSMSFGRPYIMMISGYIHDGWLLFKSRTTTVDKDYLHNILSSKLIYRLFKKATIGGVVDNLNIDLVKKIKIPLPPLPKQQEIANHITQIRNQAQLLKEQANIAIKQANQEIEQILLGN